MGYFCGSVFAGFNNYNNRNRRLNFNANRNADNRA